MQELRRRVQSDPASIAFAQLAEEYRRAGFYDEAVTSCRTGLTRHPGYLSARVTLGRALLELGQLDDAALELEVVLASAHDNLAAIRGMAEIYQRRGNLHSALDLYRRALTFARHDPELEDTVRQIARELAPVTPESPSTGLSFAEAHSELLSAGSRMASAADDPMAQEAPVAPAPSLPAEAAPAELPQDAHTQGALEATERAHEPLMDFDALLRSFGMPGATPPPLMEMLLAKARPAIAPEPMLPASPANLETGDALETLERELRSLNATSLDTAAPAAESPSIKILADLEAWLTALRRDRQGHAESP